MLRPLPNTQKPIPNTHIRRVRHGAFGSSASGVTPAARKTSCTESSYRDSCVGIESMDEYGSGNCTCFMAGLFAFLDGIDHVLSLPVRRHVEL